MDTSEEPTSLQSICHLGASELFPKHTVESEDPSLTVPFTPLSGESVLALGRTSDGVLALSNYRLYLQLNQSNYNIPLGLIEQLEVKEIFFLHITCKDAPSLSCAFSTNEHCLEWFKRLHKLTYPRKSIEDIFAFAYYAWCVEEGKDYPRLGKDPSSYTTTFQSEVERLKFNLHGTWRISQINVDYKMCPSYPPQLLVPACITDDTLENVAKFRSSRRIPAVVWRHVNNGAVIARSSQPEVGWLGWRSSDDEDLLKALSDACAYDRGESTMIDPSLGYTDSPEATITSPGNKKVLIVDARSYTTAVANRARGGGCECPEYYPSCDIQFMNLPNIHSIRKSFHAVRQLCASDADPPNWLSLLEGTRWLQHMSGLLRAAVTVASAIERDGRPVLVHCSDGWDRTPQIVALAQLLLDPYYRTIEGFQILCEREWFDFGHKFADRCGQTIGCDDPNERCPVFLQWLDCVHQLIRQFPCGFQMSPEYIVKLAQHTYSQLFGTFLCNNRQERLQFRVRERTFSVWRFLNSNSFVNYLYSPSKHQVLWPSCSVRDLVLWSEVYLGSMVTSTGDNKDKQTVGIIDIEGGEGDEPQSQMTKTRSYGDLIHAQDHNVYPHRRLSDPSITLEKRRCGERDKLRGDIAEANQRATLLAQEVDEHHICLEKSSQNQIKQLELKNAEILKDLTDQLTSERESNAATLRLMDQRLQTLQQEDQRIRTELANVLSENHTLETENQNLSEHLSKLRSSNNQLQMQIQTLVAEHDEVENVEVKENEVLVSLLVRIKKLQSDNAALRDQNDELTSELEVMKHSESDVQSSGNLDIIDSKDLTARVAELEALLASKTIRNKDISIGSNNLNAVIETQEQQLVELRSVLEKLKKELVNVVTEKKNNCTLDNCLLKNRMLDVICRIDTNLSPHPQETDSIKSLANELEAESAQLTNECSRDFVTNRTDKGKVDRKALGNDDIVKNTDKNFNNLDMKTMSKNKMTGLRDYPPRRDENGSDQSKIDREKSNVFYNVRQSSEKAENSKDCTDFDKVTDILPEVEEKYVNEKKQLSERCTELERSLDLLRTEYEQCEDYWAGKLEEERQLFEQEQRISDEKFSELIAKMAEYEEQFGNSDKTHNDGRLSPIEERFNLEQQYTNLEEEFSEWKSEMQKELTKKDQEIHDLREKLQRGNRILTVETSVQCPEELASHSNSTTGMSEVVVHGKNLSSSKITSYDTDSHVLNDSLKLKRLTESESPYAEVCTSRPASILPCLHGCSCYQIQSYSVAEGMCRAHRDELRRLHQLKINLDTECSNLIKQKEVLMQEILKLQSLRAISCSCTKTITGEQACRIDLNVLQALNARLQSQEQKCHHLQVSLKQQQQYTDRILHQTWKQHRNEIADLQFLLCGTQEKLQQHLQAYKEQAENLARADMLAKDLYLENSYLMASVERLEQHCHVLTQYSTESTSV
ncbi:uncharacterized protein LOC107221704 isoform X1 [Neodiprion lecontei]|uniref:Uncharacterized protein LOC107221704 isoform X1 n=1 Tax=Neodiprion lecontei TaxID=441921 RepID=A0ABM3FM14_NEOLC|nr:uncharacterized protein LOC107221704 isoform X1 [Neodiprion lecontei]XP_046589070.1 uncharacterized protein LOC107221704 isoform X1 [Neodiprion lecontei]XP_046589071.1 uncharacterized protein LOC107221704 isoform X1 [Neodiprion lecontei]